MRTPLASSRAWSASQIASMVGDPHSGGKDDRAPAAFYVFKNAIGLLTYTPASTAIREQVWHQLADLPGVTFDGAATDALGRPGWRLTWASPAWGSESILIDTSTGLPLEQSDRAPDADHANVTTIVAVGPAGEAPDAPSDEELRREKIAMAEGCGSLRGSAETGSVLPRTGRMPNPTDSAAACSGSRTPGAATMER